MYATSDFTIDGHDLDTLAGVNLTEMACPEDLMAAESAYIDAFVAVDRIDRDCDTLTLSGPQVGLTFGFVPPLPTADLIGTTWVLESLLLGSGADAVATSVEPPELRLDEDGTVTGTTGCRRLEGTRRRNGDEIVSLVSPLTASAPKRSAGRMDTWSASGTASPSRSKETP